MHASRQTDVGTRIPLNSNIKLPDALKGEFITFYQNANWSWHKPVCYFQYLQWHGGTKKRVHSSRSSTKGSTRSSFGCENDGGCIVA